MDRTHPSSEAVGAGRARLVGLCRLAFNFRLITAGVTLLWVPDWEGAPPILIVALGVAGVISFLGARSPDRAIRILTGHPAVLGADLLLTMAILALLGPESPFFLFTLGSALLAGVLYGRSGAVLFSILMLGLYWFVLFLRSGFSEVDTYQALVGTPLLYPLSALGGAAVRRLLDRQAETEVALGTASRAAVADRERARIAREMHDSLAKTLHGLALQAAALGRWITRDPERAVREAGSVAAAAERAADQTRRLIGDVRADSLDRPLGQAVTEYVGAWSRKSGIRAVVEAPGLAEPSAGIRWELFCILREALLNVERHATARSVEVRVRREDGAIHLEVTDDGRGFSVDHAAGLSDHFGLVGMRERADRVGGTLAVRSSPGDGTTVRAVVPLIEVAPDLAEGAGG